jgi:peptide deformylase
MSTAPLPIITYDTNKEFVEEVLQPYTIFNENHVALQKPVPESNVNSFHLTKIIKRLKLTQQKFGVLGLSANQCGVRERIMVLGTDHYNIVCINPKIVWHSTILSCDEEVCATFPGLKLKIKRPKEIGVEYFDDWGRLTSKEFQGVTARIFQHQLDILDGLLYTNKVGKVALQLAKQRQTLLIKKTQRKYK